MAEQSFDKSYKLHEQHLYKYTKDGQNAARAQGWFNKGTIGERFSLLRDSVADPLLEAYPGAQWVTVGDGRFGSDANYIEMKGGRALATDISEALLKEGLEKQYIRAYKVENAENLSFEDDSFDFVLCKESYHHFPRPAKAMYEMLRVARTGVVLLEPTDQMVYANFVQALFRNILYGLNAIGLLKLLTGRTIKRDTYEVVGNYVYKISEREIEKMALGLNYPCIAFKGFNMYYTENMDDVSDTKFSMIKLKTDVMTTLINLLEKLRLIQPHLLGAIVFKTTPSDACVQALKKAGFKVQFLTRNPYW